MSKALTDIDLIQLNIIPMKGISKFTLNWQFISTE